MAKSKAYRATDVKNVQIERLLRKAPEGPVSVGLDVAKNEVFVVVRWGNGEFERPWKAGNPAQLGLLTTMLRELGQARPLTAAMESTGTYGDPLRGQLAEAGVSLHRVGGKAASDYAEILDGVPSQHDGKDAAIVAELAAFGKSSPWPYREPTPLDAELAYWVEWLDAQQSIRMLWIGRLEGLLARHWPEATGVLGLTSLTLLQALAHYGGPAALAADPSAAQRLAEWSRGTVRPARSAALIAAASGTMGTRQTLRDRDRVRQFAALALSATRQTRRARGRLEELAQGCEVLQRQAPVIGGATACVLWAALGDPRNYFCAQAYRKAMGLNLKERSSGQHKGRVRITKRGPSIARKWLYFAALRWVQQPAVRGWYEQKKARDKDRGTGAIVAVAGKLALALHVVAVRGEPFEAWRLFPGRSVARRRLSSAVESAPDSRRAAGGTAEETILRHRPGALPPDPRDLSPGAHPEGRKKDGRR
jgi:transposase